MSSESLLELALLTVSECGFLAHIQCTLRSGFTLKKLLYVLVEAFLCCTAGMLWLPAWFWLFFTSSLHVPTLTVWVFSLAILISSHLLQTRQPGACFSPCTHVCMNHGYSLQWRVISGLDCSQIWNKYCLGEDKWKPHPVMYRIVVSTINILNNL